ncbi:carbamoyltransferase HypF [Plesiocystis pacifica]|uniref:carbamoyltransferase HypF n=1 Tax=Plesiocystis pacifica TaxID=191768 RepID=UPI0002DED110|nr:carbamoyltransferase HypF [Plesiocystis pacifica]
MAARRGQIRGIVQGVGFRPFVAGLARGLGLRGHVENRGGEVIVAIEGSAAALDAFAARLPEEAPEAAQIEAARWMEVEGGLGDGFVIRASEARGEGVLAIGPDLRVCEACLAEVGDPEDRRFGYGLNACTACGPRLTITARSPWARADSAMASFPACPACQGEFEDPEDRRWHAEAIACPDCGPRLRLEALDGRGLAGPEGAIESAAELLRRGQVLGLKGVGGFQLLVDARSEAAVETLRARKRRPHKALAVMVADLRAAAELVDLTGPAAAALDSPAGPIVLLPRRGPQAAEGVAPGQPRLGLMLPTTAAHARLLAAFGGPIVATSGNVHGRPMARTLDEARAQLTGVADALLVHDRAILRRCDDSVVQVVEGRPRALRLGRGLAPARFELPGSADASLLALGGHLQHTPAYAGEGLALVWPYVGDLDEAETRVAMGEGLADLCATIGRAPTRVVCDAHPDYATTRWAEAAQRRDPSLRVDRVWHHHAHVAAVLAEHGRAAALGVSWDGAGLGTDRSSWGGEFLLVEGARFRRLAHLRPFPLPGADAAARDGLRVLAGMLAAAELPAPRLGGEQDEALARFLSIARRPRLSPSSSAVGRLFDAFAALVGLRRRSRYQAEAACALEHAAAAHGPAPAYPFGFDGARLDWRPALVGAIDERARPGLVAARVHATLISMILAVVARHRPRTVALSGGCFANALLLAGASEALRGGGVEVLSPERLPPGDGGLALGQAWVATRSEEVGACA